MSARGPYHRRRHAKGALDPNGQLLIACRFDEELFDSIQRYAIARNISFAEMIRVFAREALSRLAAARSAA